MGNPTPEMQTILDVSTTRDDGLAVASAGSYANYLLLLQTTTSTIYLIILINWPVFKTVFYPASTSPQKSRKIP